MSYQAMRRTRDEYSDGPSGRVRTNQDEYVDILQVQQLLLEGTPNNCAVSGSGTPVPATTCSAPIASRPRLNVQRALDYHHHQYSAPLNEPKNRGVLLDSGACPPCYYGNYAEDLVALWCPAPPAPAGA